MKPQLNYYAMFDIDTQFEAIKQSIKSKNEGRNFNALS